MAGSHYRYKTEDFTELPVQLNHLNIFINFLDEFVEARNCLDMTARTDMDKVALDAKNLEVLSVEWVDIEEPATGHGDALDFTYEKDRSKLIVTLPRPVNENERFRIRTLTRCVPTDNILEGIYKDGTPEGAPQQYMSQCQQWGFQRIMPIFDDCRAKCAMTTTIEADARYTHLISNGNISRTTNPDGVPVPKPDDPSRQTITFENSVPMAPYLFLVCAGTWDELADYVTYPSGRTVRLEYLVPPGRTDGVRIPLEILKEAVLWIGRTQDYEYPAETYRTITMNKSNYGGMENVGNTTIVTDAALIDEHTLDQSLIYAHAVIVHEFEHNQCGSETTMATPFDVWLNEAYTVDVERQFTADVFDPVFTRLNQVDSIRSPLLGPLAIEDGGRAGRIVRTGFNDPDELIDGVTYVKAAEVIRMLRLVLGEGVFRQGARLYFSRYKDSNADTEQFFECFEEVSGRSLAQFKTGWLHRAGYPTVTATTAYDPESMRFTVTFTQQVDGDGEPFHIPIEAALIRPDGKPFPATEQVFELTEASAKLVFHSIPEEPAVASLNRDYSFYGVFVHESADRETLMRQTRLDTSLFNRVEAFARLTDEQRIRLLEEPSVEIDQTRLDLYGEILDDDALAPSLKAYFLRIEEQPLDRRYAAWYRELVTARETIMKAVNSRFRPKLVELFNEIDTYRPTESPKDGIEERMLKGTLLGLIAIDDSEDSHRLIVNHFTSATTAQDRVSALIALNRSSHPERRGILEQVYEQWRPFLSGYANYLRVVALGTNPDVFDMIETEKNRPSFDINQPTWARALFFTMCANTKMVWTDRGIDWVRDRVVELARINDYTASRLLNTFQQCRNLKPDEQDRVKAALGAIADKIPEEVSPTVHRQALTYLGE